jgi:hypothetical protein
VVRLVREDRAIDKFAHSLLRMACEDFEGLVRHQLRMTGLAELAKQKDKQLPYAIVVLVPDGVRETFDVFMGSNASPDESARMLAIMQAKLRTEPSIVEQVPPPGLPPMWWL